MKQKEKPRLYAGSCRDCGFSLVWRSIYTGPNSKMWPDMYWCANESCKHHNQESFTNRSVPKWVNPISPALQSLIGCVVSHKEVIDRMNVIVKDNRDWIHAKEIIDSIRDFSKRLCESIITK